MTVTDPRLETLRLLQSIDSTLKALLLVMSEKRGEPDADDRAANGPHGDPVIKAADPRDWTGPSMKGRHFSECPPDYLDLLADRFDYFASKEPDATKQRYNVLDGKRARAWAARLRNGYQVPSGTPESSPDAEPGF